MTGFVPFLAKELREIVKTWRIWVVPGLILFFALTSPLVALFTPALVTSLAGSEPGVVIRVPDPTALDAARQFLKNLNQIVLVALIIAAAGAISGERRAGTAALVLTKPLSRSSFVTAKFVAQVVLITGAILIGLAACAASTWLCFGNGLLAPLIRAVAVWWVYSLTTVAVVLFLSAAFSHTGAAVGCGLVWYLVVSLAGAWPAASLHSPAGLPGAAYALLAGQSATLAWPLATAVALTGLAVGGAVAVFRTKEL